MLVDMPKELMIGPLENSLRSYLQNENDNFFNLQLKIRRITKRKQKNTEWKKRQTGDRWEPTRAPIS